MRSERGGRGEAEQGPQGPTPREPLRFVRLTLLSRSYCHLCDEMAAALVPLIARHGAQLAVTDVDADPAHAARYGERVPVLLAGEPTSGNELCHYRLDAAVVEGALRAGRSQDG